MAKHRYSEEEIADWRKVHGSIIYFNPDDSNYMVPKPHGVGRSFNWANPLTWVMAAATVALLVYALFFRAPAA